MTDPSTTPAWQQPYRPYQAPPPEPPRKSHKLRNSIIFGGGGLVVLLLVIAAIGNSNRPGTVPAEPAVPMAITTTAAAPAAAPASPAVPQGGFAGDGTFTVPKEVAPGVYKSDGANPAEPVVNCYWARLRDTSGSLDDVLANGNGTGPITITIRKTDKAIQVQGCLPFRKS